MPTDAQKILLTGHDGFVGQHLTRLRACAPLLANGVPVDLRDASAVKRAVEAIQPDRVIHLAAQSFIPRSFENPRETFEVNFLGTLNLLQALADTGFKGRLLYIGSGDMYGLVPEAALPIREEHPLRPRNPYAVSKVAGEALCHQWSRTGPFEIVMARPFNHIGPGQQPSFAVSDFARQVTRIRAGAQPPRVEVGDIDVSRDFTDVRDVVRAYLLLLEQGENGEVYNVASGEERLISAILADLIRLTGVRAEIVPQTTRLRRAEQRRVMASAEKLERRTGWRREIPWEQTLNDIIADWEKRKHG